MHIHLRPATTDDLPALLTFEQGLVKAEQPMDSTIKVQTTYYDIPEIINSDNMLLLIAESEGRPVGCGYGKIMENPGWSINRMHGYIGFMFVEESFRGKGISDMIIRKLCEWFKENGLKEARLKVYENNPSAIKAYRKTGFKEYTKNMKMEL